MAKKPQNFTRLFFRHAFHIQYHVIIARRRARNRRQSTFNHCTRFAGTLLSYPVVKCAVITRRVRYIFFTVQISFSAYPLLLSMITSGKACLEIIIFYDEPPPLGTLFQQFLYYKEVLNLTLNSDTYRYNS